MNQDEETLCVIGLGRVGLTYALCLAACSYRVYGIDVNFRKLKKLSGGKIPFFEPGLKELLDKTLNKNFFLTRKLDVISRSHASMIAINIPIVNQQVKMENFAYTLMEIGKRMKRGHLVIIKSTIPPGTTEYAKRILEETSHMKVGEDFYLVYAPERMIEGQAIDVIKGTAQLIGSFDDKSFEKAKRMLSKLSKEVKKVSPEVAEVAKLIENYWRDATFAIANEVGLICGHLKVDAIEAIEAANFENPWSNIPIPSSGVGGACLPKDPIILAKFSEASGYKPELLLTARRLNENVPMHIFHLIKKKFLEAKKQISGSNVLLLGLAYKKGVDDVRNSPAEPLISLLKGEGAHVYAFDPYVSKYDFKKMGVKKIELRKGLRKADCVVLVTNHNEFTTYELSKYIKDDCIFVDC
jgi:nucleotide sugar dehydrogenase